MWVYKGFVSWNEWNSWTIWFNRSHSLTFEMLNLFLKYCSQKHNHNYTLWATSNTHKQYSQKNQTSDHIATLLVEGIQPFFSSRLFSTNIYGEINLLLSSWTVHKILSQRHCFKLSALKCLYQVSYPVVWNYH